MKKLRLLLTLSLIIFCCLFAFASCDDTEAVETPSGLSVENTTLQLNWKKIPDARLYTISIAKNGEEPIEKISSKNYYSLVSLSEGTYTIKVKANGKEGVSRDSSWSETISFVREKESGMTFSLINSKTEYEVTSKGTASGDIVIPDTYRGLPVTSIAKKAFFNKSDVTSVTIGKNVVSIGEFAFANCSYLTSINLPEGLTYIGENAFASCRSLTGSIVIPDGIDIIRNNTFAYCGKMESITLSDNVTRIEKSAFTDCVSLESFVMPSKLEYIGELAFSNCKKLVNIELNDGLTQIDNFAFSSLASLESIVIPDSVTRLGEGAFSRCSELGSVDLGSGITVIDQDAFELTKIWDSATNEVYVGKWLIGHKDEKVAQLNIKNDTIGIASFAFFENQYIVDLRIPESVQLIGMCAFGRSKVMTVVIGSGVREIGEQAFVACTELTDVILGELNLEMSDNTSLLGKSSLEVIGDSAFNGCAKLEKIDMPTTLKTVGSLAFRDTDMYNQSEGVVYAGDLWVVDYNDEKISANVTIKDGIVGISNYAFWRCNKLSSITLPDSVKTVGRAAFYDCMSLTTISLPKSLDRIEDFTFYRCKSLQITDILPNMLTYIGRSAFYKCGSNATITLDDTDSDELRIPSDVTYIGDFAFYGCGYSEQASLEEEEYFNYYGIDKVVLSANVKYVGASAFYGFVSLKEINLGGTETIGEKAFYNCENLKTVNFGTEIVTIGDKAFYKCAALEAVELPASVMEIGNYAFYRCEGLKTVDLGHPESIGSFAFYGDISLTTFIIPDSVFSIGKQAFRNCKALTSVAIPSSIQTVEQHVFYGCSELTIYANFSKVPEGWHKYWNSSYRPVVYGCTLSEDNSYVLSVDKGHIANLTSKTNISDPVREGYTFAGWGTSATATSPAFTSANLSEADRGVRLYAIWIEE